MNDNRNTILAVILSGLVLIGWKYFFNIPQMEKQRAAERAQSELVKPAPQAGNTAVPPTAPKTGTTRVILKYDNGDGLTFRRTIAVDDRYLFTVKDDVTNVGNAPVTLYPYALISRGGTPPVSGYAILHEGFIGYLGEQGLQEYTYKNVDDSKIQMDS